MTDEHSPIFIMGYKRSGTTLLRKILNAHIHISIPTESEYLQKIPSIRFNSVDDLSAKVASLPRCDFESNWTSKEIRSTFEQLESFHPKKLIASLYIKKGTEDGKVKFRWGDKKPQHWKYLNTLLDWYPNAQFIHITRNPFDVIASIENWMPDQVIGRNIISPHIISAWQWNYSEIYIREMQTKMHVDQYIHVQYEKLVTSPHDTIENILDFLNMIPDKSLIKAHIQDDTDVNNHNIESAREINNKNIGKGFKRFSKQQKLEITLLCNQKHSRYQYPILFYVYTKTKIELIRLLLNIAWNLRRNAEQLILRI